MRNITLAGLAGAVTIVVASAISAFTKPKLAGKAVATNPSAIATLEIMERQGRNLPIEYWADPF
jgi:hypothetical protein